MTLVEFLEARIAEEAEPAWAATPGPWDVEDRGHSIKITGSAEPFDPVAQWDQYDLPRGLDFLSDAPDVCHIARWDPTRVLADCEAKRRIVEECAQRIDDPVSYYDSPGFGRDVLRLLAQPYADHPDYNPEWAE